MTEALATLFEGKEIRVIEQAGDVWLPLIDLAKAWTISRNTLPELIERNESLFTGFSTLAHVTCATPGDNLNSVLRCVNERGLYLLMGRINSDRLKDPYARETILRFQRWVPELIQKYRKKEIVQQPSRPCIADELQKAQMLATGTGGNLTAFQKIALEKCGMGDYAPALDATPTLVHGEPGWYNATQLGEMAGLTAEQVNAYLYNKAFQYREGKIWRLNPTGEMHGKEYVYEATSGHREIRIRWRESILYASGLKIPIDESQLAQPARA